MFEKILIANRGVIAQRIARTCKRMGVTTVAIYSDADEGGVHVLACDEAVRIGPASVRESYLAAEAIIEAAKRSGAQAIHPGYGLLSEKASFARMVRDAGLAFVGPSSESIEAVGDKMRARKVATDVAGVRVVPGTDEPVSELGAARAAAEQIGYPIVVKAVGGGGGIGMQIVHDEDGLEKAMRACADRGRQAFADDRVYLEHYLERPRHVEIQILGDKTGEGIALGERECSIQRRHQKIIEESPAPALMALSRGNTVREDMCDAAIRVAQAVSYENAGTVEFLLDARGKFYFLEVNARIQVEHGVTELVTGLDLVEMQLRIAHGETLPDEATRAVPSGHAIEARVYAENPAKQFLPAPGSVDELRWPTLPAGKLRIECGVAPGLKVTPYYDPMVAKVLTHGSTRHEAVLTLDRVLAQTHLIPLTTNIPFLRRVLNHESFRAGQYDVTFAETLAAQKP